MLRPRALAAALLVAGLTAAVAAPSLRYGFVYDDEAVILERKPFWELGVADFLHSRPVGTGRHLTAVSLDLDRLEQGNVPLPFHRTNILLAAVLSVLVLALALRVGLSPFAATGAAAIFAVHPTHVDSVVWIVGRAELLAAIGVVASVLLSIRPGEEPGDRHPWRVALGTALLGVLALNSKESAMCLPLLIVLARYFLGRRVAWVPALAGSGIALLGWALLVGPLLSSLSPVQFVDNPLVYAPLFERIPKALAILWRYAWLLVWPHPLLAERSWAVTNPGMTEAWLACAAWLGAAVVAWSLRRRAPLAAFALAWFPAAFAVTGNVVKPIGTLMAERLLLLPSLSVCLLAGAALDAFANTAARRRTMTAGVVVAVAVLFALFRERAAIWVSSDVYFAASAAASPMSAKAQYDYGSFLLRKGEHLEAEAAFARALALVPTLSRAASMRAESMAKRGDPAGGAEVYLAYLALRPDDTGAVTNVIRLLLNARRAHDAVHWAQRLIELSPGDQSAIDILVQAEAAARRADQQAAGPAPAPAPPVSP